MQAVQLARNPDIYTGNSSLLLGDWNRREDVNTMIDPGTDASVIQQIERLSTGYGSNRGDLLRIPARKRTIPRKHGTSYSFWAFWASSQSSQAYITNKGGSAPCSKT